MRTIGFFIHQALQDITESRASFQPRCTPELKYHEVLMTSEFRRGHPRSQWHCHTIAAWLTSSRVYPLLVKGLPNDLAAPKELPREGLHFDAFMA